MDHWLETRDDVDVIHMTSKNVVELFTSNVLRKIEEDTDVYMFLDSGIHRASSLFICASSLACRQKALDVCYKLIQNHVGDRDGRRTRRSVSGEAKKCHDEGDEMSEEGGTYFFFLERVGTVVVMVNCGLVFTSLLFAMDEWE